MSFFFFKLYYSLKKYPKRASFKHVYSPKRKYVKIVLLFKLSYFPSGLKGYKNNWILVLTFIQINKSEKNENVNFPHLVPFSQSLSHLNNSR